MNLHQDPLIIEAGLKIPAPLPTGGAMRQLITSGRNEDHKGNSKGANIITVKDKKQECINDIDFVRTIVGSALEIYTAHPPLCHSTDTKTNKKRSVVLSLVQLKSIKMFRSIITGHSFDFNPLC